MTIEKLEVPGSTACISRLGFGCGRVRGGREFRESARLIETAAACGIRHFDTAPSYGSEAVLGAVLGSAQGFTFTTKVGVPRSSGRAPGGWGGLVYRRTVRPVLGRFPRLKARLLRRVSHLNPAPECVTLRRLQQHEVLAEIEQSLKLLQRTTLDLYLLHEPAGIEITDDLREVMEGLRRDGVVRACGLAFGGAPSPVAFAAAVEQCRYTRTGSTDDHPGRIRIHHGVVRFGMQEPPPRQSASAGAMIARALDGDRQSAVIFSASSPRQIRQITREIGSRPPRARGAAQQARP